MKKTRIVAAVMGNGHIGLLEQDIPPVTAGTVLVEVHSSLVSPGTELQGWGGLKRQRLHPDPDAKPQPFGYANAGYVLAVGEGVTKFKPGDRVACIGAGLALHTNYAVIPQNLCFPIPENVSFAQASYVMLAATSLQALRRGEPQFGESVAIVGLGLIGQLAAQLYHLAGNYIIGWDTMETRTEIARACGIDAVAVVGKDDEAALTKAFTGNYGLDAAVFAFQGDGTQVLETITPCMKCTPDGHYMGRIIVVGGITLTFPMTTTNLDIRKSSRTGAGYHDSAWELGRDYPQTYMRWTTQTNIELCLRLIAEGKLNVDTLTTHTIALENVDEEISTIIDEPEKILGVNFSMQHADSTFH
ncbi:MAG TPA: hypothetical protein VHV83_03180 [Armatimonadota bacterium]|nr:hypothetical protein [Armatimonadota bacterium]